MKHIKIGRVGNEFTCLYAVPHKKDWYDVAVDVISWIAIAGGVAFIGMIVAL